MTSLDLSPKEQSVIEELKRRTVDCVTPKMLEDDLLFYRFSKARDFNLADAETMLRKHVCWRKEFGIDTILTEYKPPEVLEKFIPSSVMCFDKEGYVVRYSDGGGCDYKGLMNCAKNPEVLKYCAYRVLQDSELFLNRNKKPGKLMFSPIFDLENIPYSTITNMKVLQFLIYLMKGYIENLPETLKCVFVINAPFYFSWAYAVFKQIIPATIVKKIQIYGTDDWKEKLLEQIDAEDLPAFLGGNRTDPDGDPLCKTIAKRGEPIPKSYYTTNEKKKMDDACEQLKILPFCKEEISFEVKEANSNLEWEYEVKSKDIDFSLYFKGENLEAVEVIPKQRIITNFETEKGLFKCEKIGTYTMVFDNSYSWIFSKEVYFRAGIKSPEDDKNGQRL